MEDLKTCTSQTPAVNSFLHFSEEFACAVYFKQNRIIEFSGINLFKYISGKENIHLPILIFEMLKTNRNTYFMKVYSSGKSIFKKCKHVLGALTLVSENFPISPLRNIVDEN